MSGLFFASVGRTLHVSRRVNVAAALFAVVLAQSALAQQPSPPATPAPPASPAAQPPVPQYPQSDQWSKLPKMQIERQFSGPLQDTVIQRLRDPVDGTICYLYLPISVAHSQTAPNGFVQYGANGIGSINCIPAPPPARAGGRK